MPYGQSPWGEAATSVQNVGDSLSRIALARAIGRQRAQQFQQQMALRQAQLDINRQRMESQQGVDAARVGQLNSSEDVNYQKMDRQDQMDQLARAIGSNMFSQQFQKSVPGGEQAVLSGDITGEPGPTAQGAQVLNQADRQADLVRNVMQLISMHNPNELGTMMLGKDISRGGVNFNPITGEMIQGNPPAPTKPDFRDPSTGMTPYQVQQLILERARLKDAEDYDKIRNIKLKEDPMYKKGLEDSSESDDENQADSESSGKTLDADTAKQFLTKAGGDKNRARQMAKDAGYTF